MRSLASALDESVSAVSLDSASGESLNAVSRYKQYRGRKQPPWTVHSTPCRGCGQAEHPEGRCASCPAFKSVCDYCGRVGHYSSVCLQKPEHVNPQKRQHPQAGYLRLSGPQAVGTPRNHASTINDVEQAPTLKVHVQSLNGQETVEVLPDSFSWVKKSMPAELISAPERFLNISPSDVKPCAVHCLP